MAPKVVVTTGEGDLIFSCGSFLITFRTEGHCGCGRLILKYGIMCYTVIFVVAPVVIVGEILVVTCSPSRTVPKVAFVTVVSCGGGRRCGRCSCM